MKQGIRILCLLLTLLLLAGCGPAPAENEPTAPEDSGAAVDSQPSEAPVPAVDGLANLAAIQSLGQSPEDNYRTWYEVFVYAFCDSDGDGIGDLQGLISKLDYLEGLGITGLWLMPVHPSISYHKYNVSDYYAIDPQYGSLADMEQLLAETEKRGMKVILDLVVNHSGADHPWFTAAVDYLKGLGDGEPNAEDCPYVDYYFFQKEQAGGYTPVAGTAWYYQSMFSPDMPDLNLDSPAVRAEIEAIMAYWFEKGADGFRLDAAKEFFSGQVSKNLEVLGWLQQTATALNPDAYLVAEVWEGFASVTEYYESGITSLFNFPFADAGGKIVTVVRAAGNASTVGSYATALQKADTAYSGSNPNYIDAPFLSNHDVGRVASFLSADENKVKLAGAMNILMSGGCFIYYGEELGMPGSGNDPSKRAPMVWNEARDNGVCQPAPECTLPESYPFGSLETQEADGTSVYNYYRQAIAIRNALPVIARGKTTAETALNMGCVSAYRKTWGDKEAIVLMNVDEKTAAVDLSAYADWSLTATLSATGEAIALDGTTLTLPAYGTAVLGK